MAKSGQTTTSVLAAEPGPIELDWATTALVIIDMQRDFLEPGGFGETLGNDVSLLQRGGRAVRDGARRRARQPACWSSTPAKVIGPICRTRRRPRSSAARRRKRIGEPGPMGRILIRGEPGHDIIPELYPLAGEPVIDKPGKGAFYATDLGADPAATAASRPCSSAASPPRSASTPRCARPTTAATAASCWPTAAPPTSRNSTRWACAMIKAQGGIFGWVSRIQQRLWRPSHRRFRNATSSWGHHDEHDHDGDDNGDSNRHCGRRATGTRSSASAPTSSSTCWC